MKVLYLIDNFSLGGAQTVVKGLMENSASNTSEYAIGLRKKMPELSINHPEASIFKSRSKYSLKVLRFLKDFISEKEIDILHCQLPRSIMLGYLLKRKFPDLKYIIHEQGDVFESRVHARLLRIFRKKADGILACSKATANMLSLRAFIEPGKINILYNFVDLSRFGPDKTSSFNGKKIAFAGRIEKRKGWREFILAADVFRDREELSFFLAGTGTEVNRLTRSIQKPKDNNIRYVGYIADMRAYYQEMDLLVIPSYFEPMGMVAVEAMACGIPVLASDVPGLNEVVKHDINGWTYPPKSVGELVRAIEGILNKNPEEINTIRERGIEDARAFSLDLFSRNLQDYYATLK